MATGDSGHSFLCEGQRQDTSFHPANLSGQISADLLWETEKLLCRGIFESWICLTEILQQTFRN